MINNKKSNRPLRWDIRHGEGARNQEQDWKSLPGSQQGMPSTQLNTTVLFLSSTQLNTRVLFILMFILIIL